MKRKLSLLLSIVLILTLFAACGEKKQQREVDDSSYKTISLKEAVINVCAEGQTITAVKKIENFAGDPYFLIEGDDIDGTRFEITLHGWSGDYMNGAYCLEKTKFEDYSDEDCKLISGNTTGVLLCVKADEYIDVMTGERIDKSVFDERFNELKASSAEKDHKSFIDPYKEATTKINQNAVDDDIKFLTGHKVTEEERPIILD